MSARLPLPGEVFESRYRIERLLGQGGFAQVFLATDLELGREVAIKVLVPQHDGHDKRNATRFMREAKLVARLNHPHIVTMFNYGSTDGGLLFAVFELVGGQDLSKLMDGPMEPKVVVAILAQVLDALAAAHEAGLLHRDVKPDNIRVFGYMDEPHRVKLLDFGIARPTKDDAGLTASGMVVGTPRFMAPEVLYEEPLGPHSDIYSVGLVAYEMLVGERSEHLQRLIHKQPVQLPADSDVGPALRRVIDRMLVREVPPRYSSAAAARLDLLAAIRERRPTPAAPRPLDVETESVATDSAESSPRQQLGRGPVIIAGFVALLLTLVAVAMLVGLSGDGEVAAPERTHTQRPASTSVRAIEVEPLPTSKARITMRAADAGVDNPARSIGCGKMTDFDGTRMLSHPDGLDLTEWVMHVPDDYDEDEPTPLVVMLHDDSGTSAQNMLNSTRFDATADRYDFLIAAPNDNDIAYPWTEREDLAYVERVVQLTREMFCVDDDRIFLLGHGGGGWGVEALSCHSWVAGVAFSAFLLEKRQFRCGPARPVPTLTILPMDSGFLPPEGGPDCVNNSKLGFQEFEAMWGERNSCSSERTPYGPREGGRCKDWGCATPYVACRVDGGRRWPGAAERAVDLFKCDGPANTFPYNETIWTFFSSIDP